MHRALSPALPNQGLHGSNIFSWSLSTIKGKKVLFLLNMRKHTASCKVEEKIFQEVGSVISLSDLSFFGLVIPCRLLLVVIPRIITETQTPCFPCLPVGWPSMGKAFSLFPPDRMWPSPAFLSHRNKVKSGRNDYLQRQRKGHNVKEEDRKRCRSNHTNASI